MTSLDKKGELFGNVPYLPCFPKSADGKAPWAIAENSVFSMRILPLQAGVPEKRPSPRRLPGKTSGSQAKLCFLRGAGCFVFPAMTNGAIAVQWY